MRVYRFERDGVGAYKADLIKDALEYLTEKWPHLAEAAHAIGFATSFDSDPELAHRWREVPSHMRLAYRFGCSPIQQLMCSFPLPEGWQAMAACGGSLAVYEVQEEAVVGGLTQCAFFAEAGRVVDTRRPDFDDPIGTGPIDVRAGAIFWPTSQQ